MNKGPKLRKFLVLGTIATVFIGLTIAAIARMSPAQASPGTTSQCDTAPGCHAYPPTQMQITATASSNTVAPGATFPVNITWSGGGTGIIGVNVEINWPTTFTTVTRDNTLFNPTPRIPYAGLNKSGSTSSTLTAPTTTGTYTVRVYASTYNPWETAYQDITINVVAPGPTTSGLTATPNPTNGATSVALSASISDVNGGNYNVAAAEYFIDSAGANGTGAAMTGAFTSPTVPVSATASVSGLSMGTHTIYAHGRDAMGNWGAMGSTVLTVSPVPQDTMGPSTTGITLSPNPTNGAISASLSATISDVTSGNATVTAAGYFIDTVGPNGYGTAMTGTFTGPTATVSATVNIAGLAAGTHVAYVQGRDGIGNWGPIVSGVLNVTAGTTPTDAQGPLTSGTSATPNPTNGATSVTLAATINDSFTGNSRIAAAEYYVDAAGPNGGGTAMSGTFTSASVSVTASANVTGLALGSHVVYLHGKDAANSWGPIMSVVFNVSPAPDLTGPVASGLVANPNPTAGASTVSLTASISDVTTGNSNVAAAEYFVDTAGANGTGTAMTSTFTSPTVSVSATANMAGRTIGTHTIYVHGKDAAGNWGATGTVTLTISPPPDAVGPVTSSVGATPNPTNGAAAVTLTANVGDATTGNSNIAAAEYFIDTVGANGAGTAMTGTFTSPTASVTASVNTSGLTIGTHTLYVHGKDAANNWGGTSSVSLSVTAQIIPPTVSTGASINITGASATLVGNFSSLGSAPYANVSFQWGTSSGNYSSETPPSTMGTTGVFQANIIGLTAGRTYYYRAKAVGAATAYGTEMSFTATPPAGAPVVTTQSAINVTSTSATLRASFDSLGNASYANVSFQWGTTSGFYSNQTTPTTMGTTGMVQANITGLVSKTTYYFRAMAVGSSTAYGAEMSFTTP